MKYLTTINIILSFYLISFSCNGQSYQNPFCDFDEEYNQLTKDTSIKDRIERLNKGIIENRGIGAMRSTQNLPVVVHIIHTPGTSIGMDNNLSEQQVLEGLALLNQSFENSGPFHTADGVSTGIQFCLAKRDPNGMPSNGITRTASNLVAENNCSSSSTNKSNGNKIKELSNWNCNEYINIWLVTDLYNESFGCSLAGFATFPGAPCGVDGIMQESRYWTTVSGTKVTAHEVGHYLGLYHTFHGGCTNNNCDVDGDRVCDTPPDASNSFAPCDTNSCSTDSPDLTDDNTNFMDYSSCQPVHFTIGQKERMLASLMLGRKELCISIACEPVVDLDVALSVANNQDCESKLCPVFTIKNIGLLEINTVKISYTIDGVNEETEWTGSIKTNEIATLEIECSDLSEGIFYMDADVITVNGLIDDNQSNNELVNIPIRVEKMSLDFEVFTISEQTKLFKNRSSGATSYLWDYGDGTISTAFEEQHTYTEDGNFTVTLTGYHDCDTVSVTKSISALSCDNGWRSYTHNAYHTAQSDDYSLCDVMTSNGEAYVPPSIALASYYWSRFEYCGEICTGRNFTITVRLKNADSDGGINAFDTALILYSEGESAGVSMMGRQWAQSYTRVFAGETTLRNLPELVLPFDEWVEVEIEFRNNVLYFRHSGEEFYQLPYDANICNLEKILIRFKGSGNVDWVRVKNENEDVVFEENFDNCNDMAISEPCQVYPLEATFEKVSDCDDPRWTINADGGNGDYEYYISSVDSFYKLQDNIITDLAPGQYEIGVRNSCPYQDTSIQIVVNEKLKLDLLTLQSINCNSEGLFIVKAQGGYPPYEYSIGNQNWQPTGEFRDLAAGEYEVKCKDSSDCETTISLTIEDQNKKLALKIDSSNLHITCIDTIAFVDVYATGSDVQHYFTLDDNEVTTEGYYENLSAGEHIIICEDEFGCISDTLKFIVADDNKDYDIYTNIEICEGEIYVVGESTYGNQGLYRDSLISSYGCDSIINTNLIVIDFQTTLTQITICEGEIYSQGNSMYETSGTYSDTLANSLGCDSLSKIELHVNPSSKVNHEVTICSNEVYKIGINTYSEQGIYIDTLVNSKGCDSILKTTLQVLPVNFSEVLHEICSGDSINILDHTYIEEGVYLDTLQSYNGCDSLISILIETIPEIENDIDYNLCQGDTLVINGYKYNEFGHYEQNLKTINGCDSLLRINISQSSVSYCDSLHCRTYIPNVFSPNDDNFSDHFEIFSNVAQIRIMKIYNRWGNLVYDEIGDNIRWNGKSDGVKVSTGVYVYTIQVQCSNGSLKNYYGDITVVK